MREDAYDRRDRRDRVIGTFALSSAPPHLVALRAPLAPLHLAEACLIAVLMPPSEDVPYFPTHALARSILPCPSMSSWPFLPPHALRLPHSRSHSLLRAPAPASYVQTSSSAGAVERQLSLEVAVMIVSVACPSFKACLLLSRLR